MKHLLDKGFDYVMKRQFLSCSYSSGQWYGLLISKHKDEIKITQHFSDLSAIISFLSENPSQLFPIVLTLDDIAVLASVSEDVITKEEVEGFLEEQVPGGNVDDFLIDYQDCLFSFSRHSFVNQIIDELQSYKEQVVAVFYQSTSGVALFKALKSIGLCEDNSIGRFQYTPVDDVVTSYRMVDAVPLQIPQDIVSAQAIGAFSGAFRYVITVGDDSTYNKKYEELACHRVFDKIKMPSLLIVLMIFLINGVAFFFLSEKNNLLKGKSSDLQILNHKLKTLQSYNLEYEDVLTSTTSLNTFSVLCDQVGVQASSGIKLEELVINPKSKDRNANQMFMEGEMIIRGVSNSKNFSDWVGELHKQPWVLEVSDQDYEGEGTSGRFSLNLKVDASKAGI